MAEINQLTGVHARKIEYLGNYQTEKFVTLSVRDSKGFMVEVRIIFAFHFLSVEGRQMSSTIAKGRSKTWEWIWWTNWIKN